MVNPCRAIIRLTAVIFCLAMASCTTIGHVLNRYDAPVLPPSCGETGGPCLFIADMHNDVLLWTRDITVESQSGHSDLPRMQKGDLRLQFFTVPTDTAPGLGACVGTEDPWLSGVLSFLQAEPSANWTSEEARALYQAAELHAYAEHSVEVRSRDLADGKSPALPALRVVSELRDLEAVMAAPRSGPPEIIGGLLGLEGIPWLAHGNPSDAEIEARLERLWDAGFRMLAPTHRYSNGLASSSEACGEDKGLSDEGQRIFRRAIARGFIIDVAHSSSETIQDILELIDDEPLVMSHGGFDDHCDEATTDPDRPACGDGGHRRNLSKSDLRGIAQAGGVIGVGFWPEAVGPGVDNIVGAFSYATRTLADTPGIDDPCRHLAFGSDFDGAVSTPFDARGFPLLLERMAQKADEAPGASTTECFRGSRLADIAGLNVCRVVASALGTQEDVDRLCR